MKIISKPKLLIQVCKKCGTVVNMKLKELVTDHSGTLKTCFKCPICWTKNEVQFNEVKQDETM